MGTAGRKIAHRAWGRAWSGGESPRVTGTRGTRPRGRQPPGWCRSPSRCVRGDFNGVARRRTVRAWRALPVRASDGEDARRCLSVWPATTRGGRRTSATFQAIKFLRSRMATIHRPFKRWKLETERDIFRKMKTRKRFQTHRSSTKSDRSKFSGGSDFFKVLPAAWTNSRPNPRMNDRIERRLGLEHTRTRHDEDRGGSVDDQEAARGHAHPHQGASSDDRDRDREIPELIDFDLFDRPPGQCTC